MSNEQAVQQVEPFIPASTTLPEITFRAIFLGIALAVLLAASSTYVGLKIARTIAGSIPAALISMLVLRRFRNANILENNMVQTIASAGETVAAGVIFTLPALIIMGYWQTFDYFKVAFITAIGGVLGVLFSVPLRRSMIVEDALAYPEGVATGEILKAGEGTKGSIRLLGLASLFSAFVAFCQSGLKVAGEQIEYWFSIGARSGTGISISLSPVLMAAGFIVGMRNLFAFVIGGALTWALAVPLCAYKYGLPSAPDLASSLAILHKSHFRLVGVGVLAVGGIWSVISILKQIEKALKASFMAMKKHKSEHAGIVRTDRDLPFKFVLLGIAFLTIPVIFLFHQFLKNTSIEPQSAVFWGLIAVSTILALILGFIAASIAAYVVGIVGTTALPVSGITIAAIMSFSGILLLLFNSLDFANNPDVALQVAALVIVFGSIVCVSAVLSGDNMQDLKAGQIVGATPWKQQLMLAVGAIASALVIPYILQTTFEAYGIADILPREGMDPSHALPAPQATLMATVARGLFGGQLSWYMIGIGAVLAVIAIIVDEFLKRQGSSIRFPVLLFALGIYLPLSYVFGFAIGGLVRLFAEWKKPINSHDQVEYGIMCASGIIAGEAILGALLTIPFAYYQSTDIIANQFGWLTSFVSSYENGIGVALYTLLCVFLYKHAKRVK